MSEKIEVVRKPMPATITIPGEKVSRFATMLEMAQAYFAREWKKNCETQSDPAKRATGIGTALETANEVLEALAHSRRE